MGGMAMLGALALKSAWQVWRSPAVDADPGAAPVVPTAHW
jgi:TRAP-type transport system small permease protein